MSDQNSLTTERVAEPLPGWRARKRQRHGLGPLRLHRRRHGDALRDNASLVALLVSKGLITCEEYEKAITEGMNEEVRRYEAILKGNYDVEIHLL